MHPPHSPQLQLSAQLEPPPPPPPLLPPLVTTSDRELLEMLAPSASKAVKVIVAEPVQPAAGARVTIPVELSIVTAISAIEME